jgi:integrase
VKGSRKVDLGAKRWLPPSTVNPWGLVPTPKAVPVTHIPRAKDELRRFVRSVAALGPAGDVLMLQALTGCRIGEIVAAKPEHIDKEARTFTVPAAVAKNGEEHRVHLSDAAWEIVERRLGGRWLFPSVTEPSLPLRADAAITLMAKVRASAKLPSGFGTHASRRAMATWVAEHGATKDLRDRMLNHVDRGSVDSRYARAALDGPAKAQWDAWGRFLTGLLADNVVHLDEARA